MAKNSGNSSRKKAGAKAKPKTSKPANPVNRRVKGGKGRNPAYVLVIMGLLTVLAVLVNRFYEKTGPVLKKDQNKFSNSEDLRKTAEPGNDAGMKPEQRDTGHLKDSKNEIIEKTSKEKPGQEDIKLFFIKFNEKTEKMYLSSVPRKVEKKSLLENAMKELIKGPTPSEKKKGLLTAVPHDLKLNSVRIKNRTAELDFNGTIERGASGSILLNRIDQIVYTATQFHTVNSVIIKINGKKQEALGADGLSIGGPLQRRE
ncbi:MAG: hypothetical protein A2W19_15900 [Spirochaetes bacterium RBG_16_49_21]|nr:MAG: hypothetical protein A2W19_15900 [Spirochaetes bacterium RBG_16_49_21]